MSDFITHSLTFKKDDINQLFVTPAFQASASLQRLDVMTDVKDGQNIHRLTVPTNITRSGATHGYSGVTGATITNSVLSVTPMKVEWGDNADFVIKTAFEYAYPKGEDQDDPLAMTPDTFYTKYVLPWMAKRVEGDYEKAVWMGDSSLVALTGTVPNAVPNAAVTTGVEAYTVYDGLWTKIWAAIVAGTIASDQIVTVTNAATIGKEVGTLTIANGTITITVNGVDYAETFDTDAATTCANWITSHKATIEALYPYEQQLTVTAASNVITITTEHKGADVAVTWAASTGSWAVVDTDATLQAAMSSGDADTYMDSMIDAIPAGMDAFFENAAFFCTKTFERNYIATLKSASGVEAAYRVKQDGTKILQYEGHDVIAVPAWDYMLANDYNKVYRHRCIFTDPKNLVIGTNGADDKEAVKTWMDDNNEERRFRVRYRVGTLIKQPGVIVIAR